MPPIYFEKNNKWIMVIGASNGEKKNTAFSYVQFNTSDNEPE